ncbi:MAG: hypothetical protein WBB64_07900 [Anaerolineales bacterium]
MQTRYFSTSSNNKQNGPKTLNPSGGISRLLAAAVINQGFRNLLLTHPAQALAQGYCGEKFALDHNEEKLVLSLQANDLTELARQITTYQEDKSAHGIRYWIPVNQPAVVLEAE